MMVRLARFTSVVTEEDEPVMDMTRQLLAASMVRLSVNVPSVFIAMMVILP
ncbi:MAG: hypothetical protein Q4C70_07145 [Planctomycetia bacterium]|nr:hypothetical protein [Planctomycetia bacterium]